MVAVLEGGLPQRGEVMMIRTMHIIRSADSAPGGADFVPLYILT